jgi:hypothetical protein
MLPICLCISTVTERRVIRANAFLYFLGMYGSRKLSSFKRSSLILITSILSSSIAEVIFLLLVQNVPKTLKAVRETRPGAKLKGVVLMTKFISFFTMLVSLFESLFHKEEKGNESGFLYPMNLQFFAEGGEGDDSGDGGENGEGGDSGDGEQKFDKAYVEKIRKEAANYRTKAKELEGQLGEVSQNTMKKVLEALGINPDPNKAFEEQLQQAQLKAQEAETKANDRLIRAEIKLQATALGIVDEEAAYTLMAKEGVKVNDNGSVEGVKESLESLLTAKPYLKAQQNNRGGGEFNSGNNEGVKPKDLKEALALRYKK